MTDGLTVELDHRKAKGQLPVTVAAIKCHLAAIGYRMDRGLDCRSDNRYMTGNYAGQSYPAVNAYVVEADTGLSFANVGARRDANFRRLQEIRFMGELFAVVRGRLLEL
jgi:hypothetical protein